MPLLVNSVPNLIQGVSQQPDSLRHPSQCEEQINAFSSVVDGLVKRQSTEFVGKISDDASNASSLFTHFVKRDEDTKYCVTVSLGGVGAFNLSLGTHIPVAVTSIAGSYLSLGSSVTNPLADLRALTVADYTFLVNKKRVVEKSTAADQKSHTPAGRADYVLYNNNVYVCTTSHTSTSSFDSTKWRKVTDTTANYQWEANAEYAAGDNEALIVVKLGDYEKAYSIYIDDNLVGTPPSLANRHGVKHSYTSITDAPPATYISGPATPASGSGHISSHSGLYADTELIAKDLKTCLDAYLTAEGLAAITAPSAVTGWLKDWSSGDSIVSYPSTTTNFDRIDYKLNEHKVVITLTQTTPNADGTDSTHTALAEAIVVKGEIATDGYQITRAGTGFNSDTATYPITATFEVKRRITSSGDALVEDWYTLNSGSYSNFYGTTPTLTYTFSNRAAFDIERNGSVIKIKSTDGPFKVRVEDGLADQALGAVYREVSSITELPVKCYNNFRVKVIGDADIDQDDYYVRFSTKEKEEFGEGTWVETIGFFQDGSSTGLITGIDTSLKQGTMPVTLVPFFKNGGINGFRLQTPNQLLIVKQGTAYYRLDKNHTAADSNKPGVGANWEDFWTEVADTTQGYLDWEADVYYYGPNETTSGSGWGGRSAGDDFTNPFPSFVGKTINDIFFFKNRLGILTDSNVIFSEADEYFNFFRTTTQQLLDSAPIDVGLSHTKVAILKHAKAFQEKLMLFSDTSQFVLRGQDVLSPKTVAISPVSEYDVSDQVEPLALGNYIYFPFKRDNYEGLYEYFVDNNTEVFTAQEVTEQVPRYIRSNVQRMAGSPIQSVICLKSDRGTEQDTLYVYKYFWSNNEKVQSAWQKFEFGHCNNICGFEFIDSTLYMLNHVGSVLQLEKLSFEDGHTETIHAFHSFRGDLGYPILLDSKIAQGVTAYTTQSYDALTNKTTISDVDIYVPASNASYELQLWTMNGAKHDITRGSEIPDKLVHDGITYTAVDSGPSDLKVEIDAFSDPDMTYNSGTKTLVISLPSPITDRTQGDIKTLYDAAGANETDVFNLSFSDLDANLTSYLSPTPLISVPVSSFTVDGPLYDYVSYEGTIYKCNLSHNSGFYPETLASPDEHKPGETQSFWSTLSGDEAVLVTSAPEWQEDRWYQGPYEFVIGYAYGMLYRFSKQTLKQPTERGGRTKSDYTFQTIRTGSLEYAESGAMQVEVYPKFRDPKRYPFNPTNLGSDSIINKFTPESGHFRFPVQTQSEELRLEVKNSSALPLRLLSAEFESMVVSRSRRYGA